MSMRSPTRTRIEYGPGESLLHQTSRLRSVGKQSARAAREKKSLATQPYEALTVTIRGKYFFDPYFGGALIPGRRNQFWPIDTLSGFSYGAVPRKFSPVNVDVRYRPSQRCMLIFVRTSDTKGGGTAGDVGDVWFEQVAGRSLLDFLLHPRGRIGALAPAVCQRRRHRTGHPARVAVESRAVSRKPGERDCLAACLCSLIFRSHPFAGSNRALISSTATLGYTWKCCMVTAQAFSFNVGLRNENRFVLPFA
jgi:LPS-assembly protein